MINPVHFSHPFDSQLIIAIAIDKCNSSPTRCSDTPKPHSSNNPTSNQAKHGLTSVPSPPDDKTVHRAGPETDDGQDGVNSLKLRPEVKCSDEQTDDRPSRLTNDVPWVGGFVICKGLWKAEFEHGCSRVGYEGPDPPEGRRGRNEESWDVQEMEGHCRLMDRDLKGCGMGNWCCDEGWLGSS